MAEILGIVARITALIQVTEKVAGYCYCYISTAENASSDAAKLNDKLELLRIVLDKLETQAQVSGGGGGLAVELEKVIKICLADIEIIREKIKPRTRARLSRFARRCQWPLKLSETAKLLSQIERYKGLFQLTLTADQIFISKTIKVFLQETHLQVADLVAIVIADLAAQRLRRQEEDDIFPDANRMAVLNWIYPHVFDKTHREISGKRQEHIGLWLFQDAVFDGWLESLEPQLLWGYGIPGAGKTFLTSLVVDKLEDRAAMSGCAVAHIYFNYNEQDQQTPCNIIRSLIKQLGTRIPSLTADLPTDLLTLYEKYHRGNTTATLGELQAALLSMVGLFTRVYFVFDALDECNERLQRKDLLPLFHLLVERGVSIFLTSRPYPYDIDQSLSSTAVPKIELSARDEDIRVYVEQSILASPHARRLIHEGLRKEVTSTMVECCKGMFLLVHFYIQDLCLSTNENQIRKTLTSLNASLGSETALNGTYSRVMTTIRGQHPSRVNLALKILRWLLTARRPLTVAELQIAVSVESLQDDCELTNADMPDTAMVIEVCAGLVVVDACNNTTRLAHYSVQEYLQESLEIRGSAMLEVGTALDCIHFLSVALVNPGLVTVSASATPGQYKVNIQPAHLMYPFLVYALTYLDSHAHSKACGGGLPTSHVVNFLGRRELLIPYACAPFPPGPWTRSLSPLHEALRWGHIGAAGKFLDDGADIAQVDSLGLTPLYIAVVEGLVDVVRRLLSQGANASEEEIDRDRQSPRRHSRALRFYSLPVHGLHDRGRRIPGGTVLHHAAHAGDSTIVRLLLESGARTGSLDSEQQTPLHHAAYSGDALTVNLLLDRGAEINARAWMTNVYRRTSMELWQDWLVGTALHIAARDGNLRIARLLLDRGADILGTGVGAFKETPLDLARYNAHSVLVALLEPLDFEATRAHARATGNTVSRKQRAGFQKCRFRTTSLGHVFFPDYNDGENRLDEE